MAKNYHFFKFIPTEWLTGDIVMEDLATQGLFVNICAIYWNKEGKLTRKDLERRFKFDDKPELSDRFKLLLNGFISENSNGFIAISFLDEQLDEINYLSKSNSKNGKKGGRPPSQTADNDREKPNQNPNKATALKNKAKKSKLELELDIELDIELELVARTKISDVFKKLNLAGDELKNETELFFQYNKSKRSNITDLEATCKLWLLRKNEFQNGNTSHKKSDQSKPGAFSEEQLNNFAKRRTSKESV